MTRAQKTESTELQLKNCHRKKGLGPKIREQKGQQKKWHLKQMTGTQKMGSKKLQVKKWHLEKMTETKKSEAKR